MWGQIHFADANGDPIVVSARAIEAMEGIYVKKESSDHPISYSKIRVRGSESAQIKKWWAGEASPD